MLDIPSYLAVGLFMYRELEDKYQKFIDRYLSTMDPTISAIDSGFDRKEATKIGVDLLLNKDIKEAIKERRAELNDMVDAIEFDKQDLLRVYWDMFTDAKKKGKLADARAILNDIARYNGVNPDEVKKEIAVLNFNLDGDKI